MRVGVDARELGGRPTGVGRYLHELLGRWQGAPACAGAELVAFTPHATRPVWQSSGGRGASLTWQHVPGGGGTLWEQRDLARAARAEHLDVLFSPAYTAPLRLRIPSVVALHDVSFAAHPEWYAWRHGLRLRWLARWSGRRAHTVLTLTEFSAAEIRRHLGVPADRIQVIPLAVDYLDAPAPARRVAPAMPVVLFVGSIFERRHLPLLIEGVAHARREVPDVRVDIIGENRTSPRQDLEGLARQHGVADALRIRDYVPDEELEAAYADAGVFAFLSSYEGFGLTPLEAMRHGLPTVVLDTSVAREVYGTGARYVRAGDAAGVGRVLVELLRDPVARAAQVAAGDAAVARYRWEDAATATWDALVKAGGTAAPRAGARPTAPGRRG